MPAPTPRQVGDQRRAPRRRSRRARRAPPRPSSAPAQTWRSTLAARAARGRRGSAASAAGSAASSASKRSHHSRPPRGRRSPSAVARVELAQHDPRLDRAVPVVDLEPHRRVDRVVLADPELRAAEGDAERPVRAAVQAEARVLALLPIGRTSRTRAAGTSSRTPGLPIPNGASRPQLLGQIEAEVGAADHRVDPLGPRQVLGPEHLVGVGGEGLAEGVEALRLAAPARRRRGARRSGQVLGAGLEAGEQVEAGDAAPRAAPAALAVERDHDRRPVVALDQPRGDDPDHARDASPRRRRPAPAPRAARRAAPAAPPRRRRRPPARSPAARRWPDSARSAISAARAASSVRNSSTPASAR